VSKKGAKKNKQKKPSAEEISYEKDLGHAYKTWDKVDVDNMLKEGSGSEDGGDGDSGGSEDEWVEVESPSAKKAAKSSKDIFDDAEIVVEEGAGGGGGGKPASSSGVNSYNSVSPEDRLRADKLKEEGNVQMKGGDHAAALAFYRKALGVDSTSSIIHSNCAQAHIKLTDYTAALAACGNALRYNGGNQKAYYRRSAAHRELGNLQLAIADLERAIAISEKGKAEGSSKTLRAELLRLRAQATHKENSRTTIDAALPWRRVKVIEREADLAPEPLPEEQPGMCEVLYSSHPERGNLLNQPKPAKPVEKKKVRKSKPTTSTPTAAGLPPPVNHTPKASPAPAPAPMPKPKAPCVPSAAPKSEKKATKKAGHGPVKKAEATNPRIPDAHELPADNRFEIVEDDEEID
jgi:hypothetical protein